MGYWGFALSPKLGIKLVAGIGTPILFIIAWALFGSPNAPVHLASEARLAFEIVWFGAGALALVLAGRVTWGVTLAVLYVLNAVLIRVWHQQ